MKQKRHSRYHIKKSDLQLLRSLASEHDLKFQVIGDAKDSAVHDGLIQFLQTDWQFAMEVARRAGLRLYARGNTLYGQVAGQTGDATAELIYSLLNDSDFKFLRAGLGLSYKLPENKKGHPGRTEVRTRGRAGRRVSGVVGAGERGTEHVHVEENLPERTTQAARHRARARRSLRRESAFEHRIQLLASFLRRYRLVQGDTVQLSNVGAFNSGKYVVDAIHYEHSSSSFTAEVNLKRDITGLRRARRVRQR